MTKQAISAATIYTVNAREEDETRIDDVGTYAAADIRAGIEGPIRQWIVREGDCFETTELTDIIDRALRGTDPVALAAETTP